MTATFGMKKTLFAFLMALVAGCVNTPHPTTGYVSPQAVSNAVPQIPIGVVQPQTTTRLEVYFVLGVDGRVGPLAITVSPVNPALDALMLAEVRRWIYVPGIINGRPVRVGMQIAIELTADKDGRILSRVGTDDGYASPENMVPDVAAIVTKQVRPVYPAVSGRQLAGTVMVDFLITTYGDVRNAYVVGSSDPSLSVAALDAVNQWKFQPAIKNGKPITTHRVVPIVFAAN